MGQRLGTKVLGSRSLRTALNVAYERASPVFADPVNRFWFRSTVTAPFVWRARLPAGVLLVPVLPELQRSWSNALVWKWPPYVHIRRLYEAYMLCRGDDGVLLDVGANDGLHSSLFLLAGWRCTAFEPQPECVAYIRRIAALNGFSRLTVEQCAVGERQASAADFYVSERSWFSSLDRGNVERFETAERISVEMITLDAYCQAHRVVPTCIKIDVEGHELQVLRGSASVLAECKPELVVEVSADPALRTNVWELLAPLGYRAYVATHEGLRAIPTLERFRAAGSGDLYVDAIFTADQTLGEQLEARLGQ
jgi:FkbM family methyltransferase